MRPNATPRVSAGATMSAIRHFCRRGHFHTVGSATSDGEEEPAGELETALPHGDQVDGVSIWSQLATSHVSRDADDAGDDQAGGEPVGLLAGHADRSP